MLKVAVAGTGLIAVQKHLPAWRNVAPLAQVVALCDVDPVRGREVADRFAVPNTYSDVATMLAAEQPDIVDICTPPRTHAAIAIQGMEAGAHVLVEKPMAMSVEECDEIIAVSERTRRSVCVGHSDLFYPSFDRLRAKVREGAIGEFRGMHIFLSTPVDYITSRPDHWANQLPGGVIGETGPHVVYMTLAFINPICQVRVHGQKLLPEFTWSPYEDYRVTLAGERATGSATLTYATNQWAAQVDVWGSTGHIRADLESQSLVHADRSSLSPAVVGLSTLSAAGQMTARMLDAGARRATGKLESTHERLIRAFCQSIERGTPPPVTPFEGRESIRVMDLIVRELQAGASA